MKSLCCLLCCLLSLGLCSCRTAEPPVPVRRLALPKYGVSLRQDHPRLFVNREMLPVVRDYSESTCSALLDEYRDCVSQLPDAPQLKILRERFTESRVAGKVVLQLKRPYSEGYGLVNGTFSREASICALVWLLDGDEEALRKGVAHLREAVAFFQWCAAHNIWTSWHGELEANALVAWDWLYSGMSEVERRELGTALLKVVAFVQPHGGADYRRCKGGPTNGNYGVGWMTWLCGLTFLGEGYDDATAQRLLDRAFRNNLAMMDYRDKVSAGSGLLSAATHGYSFGMYPYATFMFLHNLRSALGVDWARRWTQMKQFPHWFDWMAIPGDDALYTYGVGDMAHHNNKLDIGLMYTHMAQTMHFYPDMSAKVMELISMLPSRVRKVSVMFPYLPFILTGFAEQDMPTSPQLKAKPEAALFPSFGLVFSRAGTRRSDTHAMFRCGALYGNHQHYDEGSFVIFKHDFLALDAGSRTQSAHHCMFAPQSVAHNTVLIHQEGEPMPSFWHPWGSTAEKIPTGVPCHGGQYKTTGAKRLAFRHTDDYTFAANDMTGVYRREKCKRAVRRFVHVQPDVFVVFDQVESARPEQDKECLLHVQNEPVACGPQTYRSQRGQACLFQLTLLPRNASVVKVGGPGKQFWASGKNWPLPQGEKAFLNKHNHYGQWRLETKAPKNQAKTEFLQVLEAADASVQAMVPVRLVDQGSRVGAEIHCRNGKTVTVIFDRNDSAQATVTID